MIGPEGAALALATHLEAHLPAKVDELSLRLEATRLPMLERKLVRPKIIAPFDITGGLALGDYPAVLVAAQFLRSLTRVDIADTLVEAGQPVYRARYAVRILEWARGRDTDETEERGAGADRNRKRLALAVREVLLDHQAIAVTIGGTPELGPDDDGYVAGYTVAGSIDEATLVESYSDVLLDNDGTVAGAYTDLDVILEETTPAAGIAVTAINVDLLGHPDGP